MFTAVKFAEEMSISYPTMVRWLKRGLVPGAKREETPAGAFWQIPESALTMERPLAGRKPKADNGQTAASLAIEAAAKPAKKARKAAAKASKKARKKGRDQ